MNEDKDDDTLERHLEKNNFHALSVTLVHCFGKDVGSKLGSNPGAYSNPNTCQLCRVEDHTRGACPIHTYMQQKLCQMWRRTKG